MADSIALGIPCEICGGDSWWDNRQNKKNPKAPDYKCKGRECKDTSGYPMGRWEKNRAQWGQAHGAPKGGTAPQTPKAGAPNGGRLTPDDTTPDERGEKVYSWEALTYTYGKLYTAVAKCVTAHLPEGTPLDQNAVQAGVATLLIQGEKAHIPLLHPRKTTTADVQKPKPEPKKEKPLPEFDKDEWEQVGDDDTIPF